MKDPLGLVPAPIKENYMKEEMVDQTIEKAQALAKALRQFDPRLDLVHVSDRVPPGQGLVPGCWHVRRHNDMPASDSYIPITGPRGEYVEPHFGVLEELRKRDTWKYKDERYFKATNPPKKDDSGILDDAAADFRAAKRVAGEGGMKKRTWGRG